jgi:hypothetical protein
VLGLPPVGGFPINAIVARIQIDRRQDERKLVGWLELPRAPFPRVLYDHPQDGTPVLAAVMVVVLFHFRLPLE